MTDKQIERTSEGLAEFIFDELDSLNAGTSTPQMARAKASCVGQLVQLSRLAMDYARLMPQAMGQDAVVSLPRFAVGRFPTNKE